MSESLRPRLQILDWSHRSPLWENRWRAPWGCARFLAASTGKSAVQDQYGQTARFLEWEQVEKWILLKVAITSRIYDFRNWTFTTIDYDLFFVINRKNLTGYIVLVKSIICIICFFYDWSVNYIELTVLHTNGYSMT